MEQHPSASQSASSSSNAVDSTQPAKKRLWWVWVVVLALFGLLFYWVFNHKQQAQMAAASGRHAGGGMVTLTTATAHSGSIGLYLDAIGTVTPYYTASIDAQVSGVVQQVHYREGQQVRKGDPLVDIDARPYVAQLAAAQGALERDQSLLASAQMDLDRYKQAWSRNAISRQTLEDQEKLVEQDKGTVKNDAGTVQYDKVELAYCHITAPIAGRVGLRLIDPGNLVTASSSTPLVVITQLQPMTVVFTLAEDDLPMVMQQMRGGKPLKVEVYDRTQKQQLGVGKLTTVDNQIDTSTGTVKLRAEFDNRAGQLFPNQFVNTRLLVKSLDNQVLVPSSVIQHNGSLDFVYVIQDGKAVMKTVKSGTSDKGETAVQGLQADDVVANSSFEKLQNGSPVSISKMKLPSAESSDSTGSSAR
ncbi:efflux RND transporter periplasmic adaptor subunit [Telmatobacter bradus]|uniref:efflux RND transporter periplasmic adaptor subunit n=1 Tax=Telmatobacter bradus TaxID=474953 RepID=UPI003B439E9D